jgi:lipopolysaccharide/colanic/teichoic acid biosynthesis glycosyltransferase
MRMPMLKMLFDRTVAAIGLVLLSPVLLAIALAVTLQDGGPVFYHAKRVGRGGAIFSLLKFRTMVPNAERHGPLTVRQDPRVTRVGRFLRKHKLDELPQLVNVVRGDMSLVGPRPEDPRFVALYSHEQRQLLACRPGITSIASLHYRNEEELLREGDWERRYVEDILRDKLALEIAYLHRRSLLSDVKIIIQTLRGITAS